MNKNFSKNKITPWNERNKQRAETKQPGTTAYQKNFRNLVKQFFENGVKSGCKCGSVYIRAFSQNNNIIVKCANCGNQLNVIDATRTKVAAEDNEQVKMWKRSGKCPYCGYHSYGGKFYIARGNNKYLLQLQCNCCHGGWEWLGDFVKHQF